MINLSKTPLKIIGICFITVLVLTFLIPVVLNMLPTRLTGRWELAEDSSGFNYIEFFSNGSYVSSRSNYEGDYQVDGTRILLEGDLVDDIVFTFKIKGKTLNFYNDEGELVSVFQKVQQE